MQKIFSIDFSNIPITVSLNLVSNKDITILFSESIELDKSAFYQGLLQDKLDEKLVTTITSKFSEFIKKTHANNENTIVIIPPIEQISLNLELPFATPPKHLDKIIKNEVQDVMPLPGDDLHVQYQFLKRNKSTGSLPVHVSLLSENIFKNIIKILKKIGIDPFVITTPAAVLGVVSHLAKDFFKTDSAIIEKWGDFIHLLYIHNNNQVHERSLPIVLNNEAVSQDNLVSQLRIAIRAFEKDTNSQISNIYYGKNIDERIVKKIGKEVEEIDLGQFINFKSASNDVTFSALSSFLVQDSMPFSLSNFRMGKFDCVVEPQEVLKILKRMLPVTITFLVCIFIGLFSFYYIRETRIKNIYQGIKEAITDKIKLPDDVDDDPEAIIGSLTNARNVLETDLSQIASSYAISPSKILEILSLDLSTIKGVEVSSFEFKANSVKILGNVPSYSDFERLQKILDKRSNVFKNVSASQTSGKGKVINFNVIINLED